MESEQVIYMVLGGIAAFIVVKLVLFGLRKLALVLVVMAGMVLAAPCENRPPRASQISALAC